VLQVLKCYIGSRHRVASQRWREGRIVSAPSEGLFRNQPKEYQEAILPADAKIFGMTAGLPVTLQGLVGCHGKSLGDWNLSVSLLLTKYWMRNLDLLPRTYITK